MQFSHITNWLRKSNKCVNKFTFLWWKYPLLHLFGFHCCRPLSIISLRIWKRIRICYQHQWRMYQAVLYCDQFKWNNNLLLIPILKITIWLAYTIRIFSGIDHRSCGHNLHIAFSNCDHMLFDCIMLVNYSFSWRHKKWCITFEC